MRCHKGAFKGTANHGASRIGCCDAFVELRSFSEPACLLLDHFSGYEANEDEHIILMNLV